MFAGRVDVSANTKNESVSHSHVVLGAGVVINSHCRPNLTLALKSTLFVKRLCIDVNKLEYIVYTSEHNHI